MMFRVEQQEDGGVEINFNPNAVNQPGGEGHFDNLADLLTRRCFRKTRFRIK